MKLVRPDKEGSEHLVARIKEKGYSIGGIGRILFNKPYSTFHYNLKKGVFTLSEATVLAERLNCSIEDLYKPLLGNQAPEGARL